MARLGLGTAQFGMDYGIANRRGRCPETEVAEILELAARNNVDVVDTAACYGESENVIGLCLDADHPFRIVTKVPPLGNVDDKDAAKALTQGVVLDSLRRLGQDSIHAVLAHDADDLLGPVGDGMWQALKESRSRGLVEKIGASVYTGEQIDGLLEHCAPDIVQLPLNVFDQRLVRSGHLDRLAAAGVEIHVRSVFLQGVALMRGDELPEHLEPLLGLLSDWHDYLAQNHLTPLHGALAYVNSLPQVGALIVGVNGIGEFREILEAAAAPAAGLDGWERFACDNEDLIDPRNWPAVAGPDVTPAKRAGVWA